MSAAAFSSPPSTLRPLPTLPGAHVLLGHLPAFRNDLAKFLLEGAATGLEAARTPLGFTRRVAMISSPALVNEVLVTRATSFIKTQGMTVFLKPVLGEGLLTSEDQTHERARRLLAPAFTPKRMAGYAATMSERAARFASGLKDGATLDLAGAIMALTLEVVGKTLFDAEVGSDAGTVGSALTVGMEVAMGQLSSVVPIPPMIPTPGNLRYRRAVKDLDKIIYGIIRTRRAEAEDRGDVLSVLLSARDEDGKPMTDRQVRDEAMTLFLAGHETTANALSFAFWLLAQNPDVVAELRREVETVLGDRAPTLADIPRLAYTQQVVEESMRLYPPVWAFERQALQDDVIAGYHVPKGTIVGVSPYVLHRRPELFPDPLRFDPTRFDKAKVKERNKHAYLPFGGGPRTCIGNMFALMEMQIVLAMAVRRFDFSVAPDFEVVLDPSVTLRPKNGIAMTATPR